MTFFDPPDIQKNESCRRPTIRLHPHRDNSGEKSQFLRNYLPLLTFIKMKVTLQTRMNYTEH